MMRSVRFFLLVFLSFLITAPVFAGLNRAAVLRTSRQWPVRTRYEISLEIAPKSSIYSGRQKVTFVNRQNKSANYLLFFLYPNDPSLTKSEKKYLAVSGVKVDGETATSEESGPFLRIFLNKVLEPGNSVTVEFDFAATIPAQSGKDLFSETLDELLSILDPTSSSQVDYGIFSSNKDILNLGLWYPVLSKFDKTGWDEEKYSGIGDVSYFDPSDFSVSIVVPAEYHVATTGSVIKQLPQKEGKVQVQVESVMTRDFEVELSSRYQEKDRLSNRTTIRSFFLPEHGQSGALALDTAARAFEYYESQFGPYPYTELNVVEAPLFGGAGGVEFPGLVTISSLLYKDHSASGQEDLLKRLLAENPAFDQLLEFVVAHEVAHQWWNAVVGSNSKRYPFIDEAMANYSAVLYFEHYYGREAAEKQMALQMKVNYQLHRLMGGSDQPVQLPASSFHGPLEYSAIVYGKGALYFDHLRDLMGDAAFFAAMKAYYDAFWFRIAEPQDLTRIAQRYSPGKQQDIAALFQRWMNERHGDEDIGPGTLETLVKTVMATDSGAPSPDLDKLLKELDDLLKQ